jgi:hypothetical protein
MNTLPYKAFQRLYDELVQEHSDAFELMEFVIDDELVNNAMKYFEAATFPLVYPAKSYAVAIIYAHKLSEIYGLDIHTVLDDKDLFLGQDPYFVPYSEDPATYETILQRLKHKPNWLESGWAPKSVQYCLLECTEAGIQSLTEV